MVRGFQDQLFGRYMVPSGFFCKGPQHPSPLKTFTIAHSLWISLPKSCSVCHLLLYRSPRGLGSKWTQQPSNAHRCPQLWLRRAPQFSPSQTLVAWVATPITPRHTGVAPANATLDASVPGSNMVTAKLVLTSELHMYAYDSLLLSSNPTTHSSSHCWAQTWRPLSQLSACTSSKTQPISMALFLTATWGTANPILTTSPLTTICHWPKPHDHLPWHFPTQLHLILDWEALLRTPTALIATAECIFHCRRPHSCVGMVQPYNMY